MRGRFSTDHLETSGSTISISLPLINFPCILIFPLHPVLSILCLFPNSKSLPCSPSPHHPPPLFFFFSFTAPRGPIVLQVGSNGGKCTSTLAQTQKEDTNVHTWFDVRLVSNAIVMVTLPRSFAHTNEQSAYPGNLCGFLCNNTNPTHV